MQSNIKAFQVKKRLGFNPKMRRHIMKKRDFVAGFCCGAFVARASGIDLSSVFQILIISLVVLVLSSLWNWIKSAVNGKTNKYIILKRLQKEKAIIYDTKNM